MEFIEIKNLNIRINKGELVGIIGTNGSGKTHILNTICNKVHTDDIYIDNKNINNYNLNYKINNIVCVFDDNIYNTNNVKDEIRYYLNKLNINHSIIEERVNEFSKYFNLKKILNFNFENISTVDRIYVKILSLLIVLPELFCVDDLLLYLDSNKKDKILNYIKDKKITLISVTSNMEELVLFDKILVVNKGKNYYFGKTDELLKESNIFQELGLSLPFIYGINDLLKSYDLIDNYHVIDEELVNVLWK